jgi:hypothetical protein
LKGLSSLVRNIDGGRTVTEPNRPNEASDFGPVTPSANSRPSAFAPTDAEVQYAVLVLVRSDLENINAAAARRAGADKGSALRQLDDQIEVTRGVLRREQSEYPKLTAKMAEDVIREPKEKVRAGVETIRIVNSQQTFIDLYRPHLLPTAENLIDSGLRTARLSEGQVAPSVPIRTFDERFPDSFKDVTPGTKVPVAEAFDRWGPFTSAQVNAAFTKVLREDLSKVNADAKTLEGAHKYLRALGDGNDSVMQVEGSRRPLSLFEAHSVIDHPLVKPHAAGRMAWIATADTNTKQLLVDGHLPAVQKIVTRDPDVAQRLGLPVPQTFGAWPVTSAGAAAQPPSVAPDPSALADEIFAAARQSAPSGAYRPTAPGRSEGFDQMVASFRNMSTTGSYQGRQTNQPVAAGPPGLTAPGGPFRRQAAAVTSSRVEPRAFGGQGRPTPPANPFQQGRGPSTAYGRGPGAAPGAAQ